MRSSLPVAQIIMARIRAKRSAGLATSEPNAMNTHLLFFFALCLVGLGVYCISLIWHRRLLTAKDNEIAKLREEVLNLKLKLANRFSESQAADAAKNSVSRPVEIGKR